MSAVYYQCQRCGKCCRWPGLVRLRGDEPDRIARHLGLEPVDFINRFCAVTPDRQHLTLISKPDGSCVFLQEPNICTIQAAKPGQCSDFPNRWNFPGWRDVCEAIPVEAAT